MRTVKLPRKKPQAVEFGPDNKLYVGYYTDGDSHVFFDFRETEQSKVVLLKTFQGGHLCRYKMVDEVNFRFPEGYKINLRPSTLAESYGEYSSHFVTPTPFGYRVVETRVGVKSVYFGKAPVGRGTKFDPYTVELHPVVSGYYYRPHVYYGNDFEVYTVNNRGDHYLRRMNELDSKLIPLPNILHAFTGADVSYVVFSDKKKRTTSETIAFVDSKTGSVLKVMTLPVTVKQCCASPDGTLLCAWGHSDMILIDLD